MDTDTLKTEPVNRRSRGAQWFVVAVFLAALVTPLVVQVTGAGDDQAILDREQRAPTPPPSLPSDLRTWAEFPAVTDAWYGERFGLRNQLLYAYQWIKLWALNESPTTNHVVGRDDWIFSNAADALDASRGALPLTEKELADWHDSLVDKHAWLDSLGVDYAMAIVPAKATLYPEHLPHGFEKVGPSRRDQLFDVMRASPQVTMIDLYPAMLAEKANDTESDHQYFPLGLHWTHRGAYTAYLSVMDHLDARHRARPDIGADEFQRVPVPRGDDFSLAYLVDGRFDQDELEWVQDTYFSSRQLPPRGGDGSCWFETWRNEDGTLTKLLFVRDSFGSLMLPFLVQHFSEVLNLSTHHFSPAVVEAFRPDIVVELYAEPALAFHPPHLQRLFSQEELRRRFDELPHVLLAPAAEGTAPAVAGMRGSTVARDGADAVLTSRGSDAYTLPRYADRGDELCILRLDITSPNRTYAAIFYPLPGLGTYRPKIASYIPLQPGRRTVYLELPESRRDAPLGIMPGCSRGEYRIHDVEVRGGSY